MAEDRQGYLDLLWGWLKAAFQWFLDKTKPDDSVIPPLPSPDPVPPAPPEDDKPIKHMDVALDITGKFEGVGFSQLTGDFDGQGISAGVLQWNYGQGSLQQKILAPYLKRFGSIDDRFTFPEPGVDATATMAAKTALAYARKHMVEVGSRVKPHWGQAWGRFLSSPSCKIIQTEAAREVMERAEAYAKDWDMSSARAICFFFDVVTQNGSLKGVTKPKPDRAYAQTLCRFATRQNQPIWAEEIETATDEQIILFIAAYSRAALAKPAYFQDVFSRKGTIALGRGYVHGARWDLNSPGLLT